MKKNAMMRLAAILLVCVLASTCGISGTYAKYVTQASGTDTARVAKWGVRTSVSTDLFDTNYQNTPAVENDKNGDPITLAVQSSQNVVAPGTANVGTLTFTLTGVPEVAVNVDIHIKDTTKKDVFLKDGEYLDWTTGNSTTDKFTIGNIYYPIVYTLKNGAGDKLAEGNLATIEKYLEETLSGNYAPNTDLSKLNAKTDGTYVLSWAWAYQGAQTLNDSDFTKEQVDQADTLLGNLAANSTVFGVGLTVDVDYSLNVNIEFEIIITQID